MSICRIVALDPAEPWKVRGGSSRVGKNPGGLLFEGLDSRWICSLTCTNQHPCTTYSTSNEFALCPDYYAEFFQPRCIKCKQNAHTHTNTHKHTQFTLKISRLDQKSVGGEGGYWSWTVGVTFVPGIPLIISKTADNFCPCTTKLSTESNWSPSCSLPSLWAGPPGIRLLTYISRVTLCCSSSKPMLALCSFDIELSGLLDMLESSGLLKWATGYSE